MSMAGRHTNVNRLAMRRLVHERSPPHPGNTESSTRLSSGASPKDPNCETITLGVLRKQTVSQRERS